MLQNFTRILKNAYRSFTDSDPLRMAAATAFFTTFALPPILIIIVRVLGVVFNEEHMGRRIFPRLADTIGTSSTRQVVSTLRAFLNLTATWYVSLAVIVLLAFVATNLFKIIQDSINEIWKIRVIRKQGLLEKLLTRWHAVLIIMATAFLFSLAIVTEGIQSYLGSLSSQLIPGLASYLNGIFNNLFSILIVAIWFLLLFRVLPHGTPAWSTAAGGGLFTSVLFNIGKFVLRVLLIQSNINSLFGASAAFALLLLFVFYTSLILYFGASFTKALADLSNQPIVLKKNASHYKIAAIRE